MTDTGAKLVAEWPWTSERARHWWTMEQTSYKGFCAWNHKEIDEVAATRIVVTENSKGVQDARVCCDDCYPSVLKYVGRSELNVLMSSPVGAPGFGTLPSHATRDAEDPAG